MGKHKISLYVQSARRFWNSPAPIKPSWAGAARCILGCSPGLGSLSPAALDTFRLVMLH